MTYADILEHCKRQMQGCEPFTRSERFKQIYDEHKMVAELIEREETKAHCQYVEGSICGIDDGIYKPECKGFYENDDFFNWLQIRHFKFCPYCGRKIEVVE